MTDAEVKKEKKEKRVMTPEKLEQLARARRHALEIRRAGAALKAEQKELAEAALEEKLENERQVKEAVKKSLSVAKKEPTFHPTPPNQIENKIIKAELVDNPVTQEYVPEYSPRVDVQPPTLLKQPVTIYDYDDEEEEPEPPPTPIKPERVRDASRVKSKKPIKTKIVIEQSSDDEDEFHPHEHVIFVKRKSKNDSKAKVVPASTPPPPTSPVRGQRENIVLQQHQEKRQLPTFPLSNSMDDFINAGFSNYRKYY
jgi:hypothetical protein